MRLSAVQGNVKRGPGATAVAIVPADRNIAQEIELAKVDWLRAARYEGQ
jgi:hypothetical protein